MNTWSVETLNERVDEELTLLPVDMRGRFVRVSQLIEKFGPFKVGMHHIRSLNNKLWEIRVSGRDGISRGIYVLTAGKRVVVLHVFIKKTQQTPAKALLTVTQGGWTAMSKVTTPLHNRWLKTPGYKEAYDASQAEFELAQQLIETRIKSGLSQGELAPKWAHRNQPSRGSKAAHPCHPCAR